MPDPHSKPAVDTAVATDESSTLTCSVNAAGRDAAWISATGEIDLASAPQLERAIDDAQTKARLVVLDLHDLTFIDTAAVHVVVDASTYARLAGTRLVVLRGSKRVRDAFDLTGMDGAIESHRGSFDV